MAWKGFGNVVTFRVYDRFEEAPDDEEYIPRVGDVGTVINIDMGEDCSTGSNQEFYLLKSDGTETTWSPTIDVNDLNYTIITGDFNKKGWYSIAPYIELP